MSRNYIQGGNKKKEIKKNYSQIKPVISKNPQIQ